MSPTDFPDAFRIGERRNPNARIHCMNEVGRDDQDDDRVDPPTVGRKPTREDLREAAAAARSAAMEAEHAAHNAAAVADSMLAALETGPVRVPSGAENPDVDDPDPPDEDGDEPESDEAMEPQGSTRPGRTGTGPAAVATGHGLMRMGPTRSSRPAFEQFMLALREPLEQAKGRIRVTEIAGWVKIEGQQGHKVYIAKTVTGVSRVESTLDPEMVSGARAPDPGRRRNGRIASWIPARPESVREAIELLARLDEPIRPPTRGGPAR